MRKKVFVIGFGLILIISALSGCQDQDNQIEAITFEGITLVSNVVELVNASLDFHTHYEGGYEIIDSIDVQYLFHNIAGRDITVTVTVEFYDENDNLLEIGGPKHIRLLENYTEHGVMGANIISYDGEEVYRVDHVRIVAVEQSR